MHIIHSLVEKRDIHKPGGSEFEPILRTEALHGLLVPDQVTQNRDKGLKGLRLYDGDWKTFSKLRTRRYFFELGNQAHLPGQAEEDPGPDLKSRNEKDGRSITVWPSMGVNPAASAEDPGKICHGMYFQFWNCNLQMPKREEEIRTFSRAWH
jgi:hypothetical protein